MRYPTKRLAVLCLVAVLLASVAGACTAAPPAPPVTTPAATYDGSVPITWFSLSLTLVKETPGYSPPVASRAFAYLGVALYETVRPGMDGYATLAGQLNELDTLPQLEDPAGYHWALAANRALAETIRALFPTASAENLMAVAALEEQINSFYAATTDAQTIARSVAWGQAVADAVYRWSLTDGGNGGYTRSFPEDYAPPTGAGMWVSTPPNFSRALQPYWGENRPFVLPSGDGCPALPPPTYSKLRGSAFYQEAWEVYTTAANLDEDQLAIARFWADDPGLTSTPPGHWISILNRVLAEQDGTLDQAAEAYAKLGIGLADAFISCWKTKYAYNLIRPISYIQDVIDPTWNTPDITDAVVTPPFPEYTSGHSVQSAAAAVILTDLFGEDYAFIDHTHDARGYAARSYPSFMAAANEAAISRLYGGIHYRAAIENGLAQGECIGNHVLALRFQGSQVAPLLVMRR